MGEEKTREELIALQRRVIQLHEDLQVSDKRFRQEQDKNHKLEEKLSLATKSDGSYITKLEHQVTSLEGELKKEQDKLNKLRREQGDQNNQHQLQLKKREQEIEILKLQASDRHHSSSDNELKEKNRRLQERVIELEEQLDEKERRIRELDQDVEHLQKSNEDMADSIQEIQQVQSALQGLKESKTAEVERLLEKMRILSAELLQTKADKERAISDLEGLSKQLENNGLSEHEKIQLRERVTELELLLDDKARSLEQAQLLLTSEKSVPPMIEDRKPSRGTLGRKKDPPSSSKQYTLTRQNQLPTTSTKSRRTKSPGGAISPSSADRYEKKRVRPSNINTSRDYISYPHVISQTVTSPQPPPPSHHMNDEDVDPLLRTYPFTVSHPAFNCGDRSSPVPAPHTYVGRSNTPPAHNHTDEGGRAISPRPTLTAPPQALDAVAISNSHNRTRSPQSRSKDRSGSSGGGGGTGSGNGSGSGISVAMIQSSQYDLPVRDDGTRGGRGASSSDRKSTKNGMFAKDSKKDKSRARSPTGTSPSRGRRSNSARKSGGLNSPTTVHNAAREGEEELYETGLMNDDHSAWAPQQSAAELKQQLESARHEARLMAKVRR